MASLCGGVPRMDCMADDDVGVLAESARTLLREHGAVLLPGGFDYPRYLSFTEAFGAEFMPHRGGALGRQSIDEGAMVSTAPGGRNNQAMDMHGEMYYQGIRPDLLFFMCVCPPAADGETLVADGADVHDEIGRQIGCDFLARRITYHRRRSKEVWTQVFGTSCRSELADYCAQNAIEFEFEHDEVLYTRYSDRIAHDVLWGGRKAFVNNMLTWAFQALRRPREATVWITYEDGAALDRAELIEADRIVRAHTRPHAWSAGELLVLDNSRMLHGRNAFSDPARHILLRMGRVERGRA